MGKNVYESEKNIAFVRAKSFKRNVMRVLAIFSLESNIQTMAFAITRFPLCVLRCSSNDFARIHIPTPFLLLLKNQKSYI